MQICALVPTYNNPRTIHSVVERIRSHVSNVIIVDDGSEESTRRAIAELEAPGVVVVRRPINGGKGAAVKTGLLAAQDLGYSHAMQIDADGQHSFDDIPYFLEIARKQPQGLILGSPRFDESAPRARLWARKITQFWTNLEAGRVIEDPMCGFRIYPVDAAIKAGARGNRMDFDPEIAVRMVWQGTQVTNLPTQVRYVSAGEGGVSHFRMVRDNALISWMHTRLVFGALLRKLVQALAQVKQWLSTAG